MVHSTSFCSCCWSNNSNHNNNHNVALPCFLSCFLPCVKILQLVVRWQQQNWSFCHAPVYCHHVPVIVVSWWKRCNALISLVVQHGMHTLSVCVFVVLFLHRPVEQIIFALWGLNATYVRQISWDISFSNRNTWWPHDTFQYVVNHVEEWNVNDFWILFFSGPNKSFLFMESDYSIKAIVNRF